nr:NAD(P)H-dependent oxidoreductase [Bifidobacterium catenulatum]
MKTLVLVFHPHVEDSHVNRKLMDVAEKVDGVTVVDEYAAYPDFKVDMEREHTLLQEYDRIVLQFPFYWYSAPALLKQWEDDVLNIGWAYGGDYALEGKEIMVAVSTGAPAECYTYDGSQARTMEELLSPYEALARYVHASYRKPFLVHGAATSTEKQLDEVIAQYSTFLTGR